MQIKQKKALRQAIQAERNALTKAQKAIYDLKINQVLRALVQELNCQKVHAYLPMKAEIDIYPLIQELLTSDIKVYIPKTLKERKLEHLELHSLTEIETGLWGTQHPKNSSIYTGSFDLIIVPGLAFDLDYNRLGYGGGYYDNFLKEHRHACKIAIAYPFQIVKKVPVEAHDTKVDKVIYGGFD